MNIVNILQFAFQARKHKKLRSSEMTRNSYIPTYFQKILLNFSFQIFILLLRRPSKFILGGACPPGPYATTPLQRTQLLEYTS